MLFVHVYLKTGYRPVYSSTQYKSKTPIIPVTVCVMKQSTNLFYQRLRACIKADGGHFEHLIN